MNRWYFLTLPSMSLLFWNINRNCKYVLIGVAVYIGIVYILQHANATNYIYHQEEWLGNTVLIYIVPSIIFTPINI